MVKALGLDLGVKTLGVAKNDFLGFVHGVETYRFKSLDFASACLRVKQLVEELNIEVIALGYPLTLKGNMSEMANNVLAFKNMLNETCPNVRIELIDERLTSVSANRTLSTLNVSHQKRKETVDTLAAIEILETFIRKENQK